MKAVIFDMDGVIFDTERLCLSCWEQMAKEDGLGDIREAFVKCIGVTMERTKEIILEHFGKDFDYDAYAARSSELFQNYVNEHGMPIKEGAREFLEYLTIRKIPIGLASSTPLALVEQELKSVGLYDFFDVVVGGDLLKKSKPEPDIYLMACQKMGVEPANAIAIEDSYNGIRSAYSAGMQAVMVPDLLPVTTEMQEKTVTIQENLFDVKKWFETQRH